MKGYIVLENGDIFSGQFIGEERTDVFGEAVFFTGMTGYQEVATDPSYRGQIVIFTYPFIGNYGVHPGKDQSEEWHPRALVMGECASDGYHYQSEETLASHAEKVGVPILTDVDTRALVKTIRKSGAMGAVMTTDPDTVVWNHYTSIEEKPLVNEVSTSETETHGSGDTHIVLVDFGHKKAMVDALCAHGAKVTVVPFDTDLKTIQAFAPDGLLLTNGPGNPKQLEEQLPEIKAAIMQYPTFAICLGHQLIALAFGGDTSKLKFGHRGANQPVLEKASGRVDMTAQNHSYVVDKASLEGTDLVVTHVNVNDDSVEGLAHKRLPIKSVQYHPEANPGPEDSQHLFLTIFQMIAEEKEVTIHA
ncbi:carbamoyl phosphate synthase small subunit [Natribacillus halophilus]|uniref:Carbamoyl phosphate synthase small chain n=1 Tax=Natribacillus halophilus TaxID=549003 RepID=A0A1G8LI64_9BACI|nr:carbamoyl phosphate synthase small subunit [Natribacillus halophilus]SDI54890.1 carbamoyl-phosphate synthase small subunit [Natribacillus halophilus]